MSVEIKDLMDRQQLGGLFRSQMMAIFSLWGMSPLGKWVFWWEDPWGLWTDDSLADR